MKLALHLAGILALLSVGWLCLTLSATVQRLEPQVSMTLRGLHASANETALTMKNVREGTLEWKKASQAQALYSTEAAAQLKRDLVDIDALVKRTDAQLNDGVLPDLAHAVTHQDAELAATQAQVRITLFNFSRDSSATLAQSKNLLDQLDQDASDPAIHSSLEQIQLVTTNVAGTSKDLKDVADKFRNDYLKPQKFAWELLKSLAGMGGSVASMVK
jgi:hypothetical protein